MPQRHTTTNSIRTYIRIAELFLLSMAFTFFIPYTEGSGSGLYWNQSVNMGILYAIIVGFLMSLSLTRKQLIEEKIGTELNKIRRIYHLSFHLSEANPKLLAWKNQMAASIRDYLSMFCNKSFYQYEEGDSLFRKISYGVYRLPTVGVGYNSELYQFLIDTVGEATEARQFIKQKKDDYIGYFQWAVIIVITVTFASIMTAATPFDPVSRTVTTFVIFNLFLALDLLNEYDRINAKKSRYLADLYAENLPELMHCAPVSKASRSRRKAKS